MLPKMKISTSAWLALILLLYFSLRLPFTSALPFLKDENLYALMSDNMLSSPSLLPELFNQQLAWRPALFFYVYGPFSALLSGFPLPIEYAYRLPSVLFGAACVLILYKFVLELYKDRDLALLSSAIFAANPLAVYVNNTVLVDTFLLLFILLSLLCYLRGIKNPKYFMAAALFTFLAFMVKTVVAFIIPPLAIALLFFHGRHMLKNRLFLLSLLAIPLAMLCYYLMFQDKQMLIDEFTKNVTQKLPSSETDSSPTSLFNRIWDSLWLFLAFCIVWLGFYASGIFLYWRKHPFLIFWCLFIAFAISGGIGMPWYYLPVLPQLCIFAALPILAGQKADAFTAIAIAFLILISCVVSVIFYVQNIFGFSQMHEKNAGLYLHNKDNVLLIGGYSSGTLFYKTHSESPKTSMCWFYTSLPENMTAQQARQIIYDYPSYSNNTYSRLTDFFWEKRDFKLPCTAPEKFDYIAAIGVQPKIMAALPDYSLAANFSTNSTNFTIYERTR